MSELVSLTVVQNLAEAELLINRLALESIPAMQRSASAGGLLPETYGGQVDVLVREEDLERARELLGPPEEPE